VSPADLPDGWVAPAVPALARRELVAGLPLQALVVVVFLCGFAVLFTDLWPEALATAVFLVVGGTWATRDEPYFWELVMVTVRDTPTVLH
jgi:type IV secretory pathway VirB3-like protein